MASIAGIFITISFDWVVRIWLHHAVPVPISLLAGFAVWNVLNAGGTALAAFLNAASVIRFQVVIASIFAALCLGLKVLMLIKASIAWLPWVTAVTWILTNAVPLICFRRRILTSVFSRKY
jgi:predicted membrane-bound spermidine synthase